MDLTRAAGCDVVELTDRDQRRNPDLAEAVRDVPTGHCPSEVSVVVEPCSLKAHGFEDPPIRVLGGPRNLEGLVLTVLRKPSSELFCSA